MKKLFVTVIITLLLAVAVSAQSNPPIRVQEADGSPARTNPTHLIYPNGSLTISGGRVTIAAGGGSGSVTNVSVVTNHGVSGSVGDPTGAAAITLSLGIINPLGIDMTGTAGQAHVFFPAQASVNTTTSPGFAITSDSSKRFVIGTQGVQNTILNFLSIATTPKEFTFPNASGTIALTSDIPAAGATTALDNLASVAVNTSLLPASTQSLGSATFPWLESFVGNTTQYESVTQSAGLITHTAAGSATNISIAIRAKGFQQIRFGYNATNYWAFDGGIGGTTSLLGSNASYLGFASTASAPAGVDVAIGRSAAGVLQILGPSLVGWGSLLTGVRDAGTTTVQPGITIGRQSTGTPAAGFGPALLFRAQSSTTDNQDAAQIAAPWTTATHASRTADFTLSLVNNAAALAEVFRVKGNGLIVLPQTITAGGTTGNVTIDKIAGTVNVAAAGTTVTVTNALVSTSSTIYVMARTNDSTCAVKNVVPGAGSFVVNLTAACNAETSFGFIVFN